jgi:hypothetical protein
MRVAEIDLLHWRRADQTWMGRYMVAITQHIGSGTLYFGFPAREELRASVRWSL